MDEQIRRELMQMGEEDLATRARLAAEGSRSEGYDPEMQAVHDRNADRLAAMIDEFGWPGRSLAGEDGARAAWLVLQHAIARPALQRRGLALLRAASDRGEATAAEVATLEDRICFFEGRRQNYGTQYDWDRVGELSPLPIEDAEHVDDRRAALGLPPLEENTRRMRRDAAREGRGAPRDWESRHAAFVAWTRSVGWRP